MFVYMFLYVIITDKTSSWFKIVENNFYTLFDEWPLKVQWNFVGGAMYNVRSKFNDPTLVFIAS